MFINGLWWGMVSFASVVRVQLKSCSFAPDDSPDLRVYDTYQIS